MKKTTFHAFYFLFFISIIVSFLLFNLPYFQNKNIDKVKNSFRSKVLNDTILRVYYDKYDHNSPKILLKSGQKIDFSFVLNSDEILRKSKSGDIIKKSKNSFDLHLFKNDTSILIGMKFLN